MVVSAMPVLVAAQEYSKTVCTVYMEFDPKKEEEYPVTYCVHVDQRSISTHIRINRLSVNVTSGGCFYLGTRPTNWVNLGFDDDGNLKYGWSPDGKPGGHRVVGIAPRCTWTRIEAEEIEGYLWNKIGSYTHQAPQVSLDPPVARGMVGIETFAGLSVPSPWTFASTSPYTGRSLSAEAKVWEVRINWDDGPGERFNENSFSGFTGYPGGVASHTYQTKSCDATGPRCRPETGVYDVDTRFVWSGWYQVGGKRTNLIIPDTSSIIGYPVSEMISLVVG